MTCGEAIVKLLEKYDVDTVFGIPGVHNLELYRGLADSGLRHILTRHEQGAGFMADGYARVSSKPGVCFVISGPGVTNISTPMGQAYSDSVPMLVISSDAPSKTLGKGLGYLHEVTDLSAVTKPLTAFSATVTSPEEVPKVLARAFNIFASERPRPVHIAVPLDILATDAEGAWKTQAIPTKPTPISDEVNLAAELLTEATRPLVIVGGGFANTGAANLKALVERLDVPFVTTSTGKGILSETHPLSLGASVSQKATQALISDADVVLALGTELADTDCFEGHYGFSGKLIHIDIDAKQIGNFFETELGIVADAAVMVEVLLEELGNISPTYSDKSGNVREKVGKIKQGILESLSPLEKEHHILLKNLRNALPENAFVTADMTQLAYSAVYLFEVPKPNSWFFPMGYGTLGYALPAAIGAKFAALERAGAVLVGDAGFQYTLQELGTAVEHNLSLPIILWNNGGLGEIERSMEAVSIDPVQVTPHNPDFVALAKAYGCDALKVKSKKAFEQAVSESQEKDKPTLIEVRQGSEWLKCD